LIAVILHCAVLWASRNGRKIITQCGRAQRLITGNHERRIHLPLVVPPAGYAGTNTFAW